MAIKTYLFLKSSGRCPLEEYILSLNSKREVAYIHATIDKLTQHDGHLPPPYAKKVREKIWEMRSPLGNRVFYFIDLGRQIILLDGYTKKTNRIAPRVLKRVMNMYREYLITKHRKPY
ncbi:MAG: type II toxin-antitoxin system RelE/ParE family toxin [bacterium]|nr:type II toxin-antitoxin system RelE/ParE family toxin [bacterium]